MLWYYNAHTNANRSSESGGFQMEKSATTLKTDNLRIDDTPG